MCLFKYRIAGPYEILLISGDGNKKTKFRRKSLIWPGQTCTALHTGLKTFNLEVKATSSEKLSFHAPVSFAIGPWTRDKASMLKYAKFVSRAKTFPYDDIKNLLKATIEGEMRTLAASMTYEELSKATKDFRDIVDKARVHLSKFGLFVYFAYINNDLVYSRDHMEAMDPSTMKAEDCIRYSREAAADASLYSSQKDEDGSLYEKQKQVDGLLYAKEKEAQGTKAVEEAKRVYNAMLLKAFRGNHGDVKSYLRQGGKLS